ncbi:MAG: hypothetical protein F4137_25670 [Acidobacteria bacterium]|nr:hypothetical protein [Acidobacteriota bacterium]
MNINVALEGQRVADGQSYIMWLLFGVFFFLVGPLFAHVTSPTVPPEVLAKGPTDPQQQQVFMGAYIGQAKSHRIKYAWLGAAGFVVLTFSACVACGLMIGSAGIGGGMR